MTLSNSRLCRARVLGCIALLGALYTPAAHAQTSDPSARASLAAGPVRTTRLGSTPPPAFLVAPAGLAPSVTVRGATSSKRGTALLLIGAGAAMIYGGRELQDAIGFPGAVVRYTGIGSVGLGALFACGCL